MTHYGLVQIIELSNNVLLPKKRRKFKNSTVFETQTDWFLMAANYIDITPGLIRLYFFHSILRDLDAEFLRRYLDWTNFQILLISKFTDFSSCMFAKTCIWTNHNPNGVSRR